MTFTEKPPILRGSEREQLQQLRDYLFRMASSLDDVTKAGTAEQTGVQISVRNDGHQVLRPGSGQTDIKAVMQNARELKSLIIKSAKELQDQIDNIETTNFYIKYADDFTGDYPAEMYSVPTDDTCYMGVCTTAATTAPTDPSAYTWSRIRGEGGGLNSATVYLYMRAEQAPQKPQVNATYTFLTGTLDLSGSQGVTGHKAVLSGGSVTGHKAKINGAGVSGHKVTMSRWTQEIPTDNGQPCWVIQAMAISEEMSVEIAPGDWTEPVIFTETGKTPYLHIKYSDDGRTFTGNDGEDLGAFIGMYTDYSQRDSMDFDAYEWHRFSDDTELKAMIEAGDNYVMEYCDNKVEEYNGLYVAKSEFGTFEESINSRIETTARGVVEGYGYSASIESMQDSIDLMQDYFTNINGEIRRGIVTDPETGEYVTGIAISQNLQFTGECGPRDPNNPGDGHTYYYMNSGQTFGLYTSTGWQFWIDGYKRGWFNSVDGMLHVANIVVEVSMEIGPDWQMRAIPATAELEILYIGG